MSLIIFIAASILLCSFHIYMKNKEASKTLVFICGLWLCFMFSLISSNQPIIPESDMAGYLNTIQSYKHLSLEEYLSVLRYEFGFTLIMYLFSALSSTSAFVFVIPLIQSLVFLLIVNSIFKPKTSILVMYLFVTYFVSYNASINVLRQGIAMPIFVFAYVMYINKRYYWFVLFSLLATLFHNTVLIMFIPILIMHFRINIVTCAIVYLFSMLLSFLNLNEWLIRPLMDLSGVSDSYFYIVNDDSLYDFYQVGFRFDFLLFTALPLSLYFLIRKIYGSDYFSNSTNQWFSFYIILGTVAQLLTFIPFVDRIYMYSWYLFPILLGMIVSDLYNNRHKTDTLVSSVKYIELSGVFSIVLYSSAFVMGIYRCVY